MDLILMEMISTTIGGLENGYLPVMSAEGSGGVYFMKDNSGESNVAVFKPIDEEPMAENNPRSLPLSVDGEGLKRGTLVGEGALREVAEYLLDHPQLMDANQMVLLDFLVYLPLHWFVLCIRGRGLKLDLCKCLCRIVEVVRIWALKLFLSRRFRKLPF